ncbi:MAG: sensor hybrid histidine kinase [Verrucomicrobiales bacterium]|nr:sensor hybrid histidine kinase [Verrucomicrobiales bacterium]
MTAKRILVADDNKTNLKLLRAMLEAEGLTVIEADDGMAALAILKCERVDAIISDILMPNMDGYRLCYEVRKHEGFSDLPFIFYTNTYLSPADEKLAMDLGGDKFVRKPASSNVILEALSEATSHSRRANRGLQTPPPEMELLKEYSERLVNKLEEKNRELARQAEELQNKDERFRELAEQIGEVFWITNVDKTQLLYVNPAYEKIWGRKCASLYKAPGEWLDAVHPDDRERVRQAAMTKQIAGEFDEEFRITHTDGTIRWIRDRAFPVRDQLGNVVRIVGVADDITERKNLEDQFRQSQKMEAIGQLAGGVAHDFNNLLTIIQGYTAFLLQAENLTDQNREEIQHIETAADMAASLTRQLLMFSRKQMMQFKPTNLNEIVKGVSKMLRRLIGEDICLQTDCVSDLPLITADAGMIEQILLNLSVNARDAMPNGGKLVINASPVVFDDDLGGCSERRPGQFIRLRVSDTGCGMTQEVIAHIFEPFFTTKGLGKGTGLGLATVYGIAKQHYGWIEVSSEVGKGTSFDVYFPQETTSYVPREKKSTKPETRGRETILVVEDELIVRQLVRKLLESRGYQVLEANSGPAALEIWRIQSEQIHLLLTDIIMPEGINGWELGRRLAAEKPNLKVVYTTGYSDFHERAGFELDHSVNFIQKPYMPKEFLKAIRDVLDGTPI